MLTIEERRIRILSQHAELRDVVGHVLETASRIAAGDEGRRGTLRAQLARVALALRLHLLDEEKLIEPVLARAGRRGADLLARMSRDHAQQRAVLTALHSGLGGAVSARGLAANAVAVGRQLLEDMEVEESEMLSPEVLGDALVERPL